MFPIDVSGNAERVAGRVLYLFTGKKDGNEPADRLVGKPFSILTVS